MLTIGTTDRFEREYTQKFRNFAGQFGEFVAYERDRAARDIGVHLTRKLRSGNERMTSALCWFQLKGITKSSLPKHEFDDSSQIGVPLKVRHLRFWYLQPMPTYLALFVESADSFLVLNLQQYVERRWGRSIFALAQNDVTVEVPRGSLLDDQAFHLIMSKSDEQEWARALGDQEESARLCRRDYDLIWHFGTAVKRKVEHRLKIVAWQSKTRGEVIVEETTREREEWIVLRNHWQFLLRAPDVEEMYPYLELYSLEEDELWSNDEETVSELTLANGDVVRGVDYSGEYFEYIVGARLNRLGRRLLKSVRMLERLGLIEINEDMGEFVSIAPWERRSV